MGRVNPRTQPRIQPTEVRRANFEEVIQGIRPEDVIDEAYRCLQCEGARCQEACPLHNQIPKWMRKVTEGRFEDAYRILRETSPMPELCSRLCPQERLCEGACALGIKHEPVAIGLLERFVSERGETGFKSNGSPHAPRVTVKKRAAAIGSGPASLAFAQILARQGHSVTVFERWPHAGGVLRWIPRFKMPEAVLDKHIETLVKLGVSFKTGVEVRTSGELLSKGFDAVFVGIGASRPSSPKIPGIALGNILSSTEFLVRVYYDPKAVPNGWKPITGLAGRRIVVLGGGDSAMDCVRTAIRLGSTDVSLLYRRDEANMPGSKKEVKATKEEGVRMEYLAAPVAFHTDDAANVSRVECVRMELGPPDASGRRSPVAIEGSTFIKEADLVVLAFGYEVEGGVVKTHSATGATAAPGVFAGGDCVTGPNLVCTAARQGVLAAQGASRYFAGEAWETLLK